LNENNRKWAASNLDPYGDFEDFIIRGLNKPSIQQYVHFRPQYGFLCMPYSQEIHLDFLGLFENIQDDFKYIKSKLSMNATLSYENVTVSYEKLNYKDYYTNKMRDIVSDVYERDIELLGYAFDNSSLKSQLTSRST